MDNVALYHLEEYLFKTVGPTFQIKGELSAFEFFCIVIWKANRAKSKIALKLLAFDKKNRRDLDSIIRNLSRSLHSVPEKEKLRILVEDWGFKLPMATAILTVLWPDDFTIYDFRVCSTLGKHHNLLNRTKFENLWKGYEEFKSDVEASTPATLSLRDKDKFLWGESFKNQLVSNIKCCFQ